MNKLPDFTDPNPSAEWLWAEQQRLHKQADKLLAETKLLDVFSEFGIVQPVGGSYDYGLMVYPDLDMSIITENITRERVSELAARLVNNGLIRKVAVVDTVAFPLLKRNRPKGYWIGLEIPFEDDMWGVDCWLQQPDWVSHEADHYKADLAALDDEQKLAVLNIKYQLIYRGLYGKQYFSVDVYDAVLQKNVRTIEDFLG